MASLKTGIVEDFSHIYTSIKFEMQKHLKRKRLVIGLLLATAIPVLFYIIPKIWDVPFIGTAKLFLSTNLSFINILIIISSALFAGDAVSGEFERKTALLTFPTPQRRISIFVGKYCAALIAISVLVSPEFILCIISCIFSSVKLGFLPRCLPYSFAFLIPSNCLSFIFALSNSATAPII